MKPLTDQGFSLLEVMMAMLISSVALMGAMGALEVAARHARQSDLAARALGLAQDRLEAKRSMTWQALLSDDLDHDGIPDTLMNDDGQGPDRIAGDGIFTALHEQDGVTLVWTVEADRPGPINAAGLVTVRARASFAGAQGLKEIHLATLRANPMYRGAR